MLKRALNTMVMVLASSAAWGADDDILVADFEQEDYGAWTAEGTAFGPGPARGTLPGQMPVSGFEGERLVNTFFEGDATTGTLTSPPLSINRDYLRFLIGGGAHEGATCINLLLEGEVVRTATGPNLAAGGSEELISHYWDVADLAGETVTIQIVDSATGGWGHVNIDHIVLTNEKPKTPNRTAVLTKEFALDQRYLLFPVRTGARTSRVELRIDGDNVREFDVELADDEGEADLWSYLDVASFAGETATLRVRGASEESLERIVPSNELPEGDGLYDEPLRPQFHFSQRVGWNNDPNGMVYADGEWHLYFQHNPYGWNWGNMHWGHAVSRDLVHWEQLPIAIYNPRHGDWAFSGGAVVDEHNTAGWQTGDDPVIVASWTSTGRGECISYSNDGGRTFKEYEGNPVVRHDGRDPKIIWYEPGRHWVMAVYDEFEGRQAVAFHTSHDLKTWEFQSRLDGYFECPEIFDLGGDGDTEDARWVVFAADARYAIGSFNGKEFTPDHDGKHQVHYGEFYASQLFSNAPDGRRIQIGWARIPMPGMPFNQTFSFPYELSLQTTDDGPRLFAEPVREIELLHRKRHTIEDRNLSPGESAELRVEREILDIRATFAVGDAERVGLDVGGERITYDVSGFKLNGAPLEPVDGRISLQVLVDRPMLEIIGNEGRVVITKPRERAGEVPSVRAFADGGSATLIGLDVYELNSIWRMPRD